MGTDLLVSLSYFMYRVIYVLRVRVISDFTHTQRTHTTPAPCHRQLSPRRCPAARECARRHAHSAHTIHTQVVLKSTRRPARHYNTQYPLCDPSSTCLACVIVRTPPLHKTPIRPLLSLLFLRLHLSSLHTHASTVVRLFLAYCVLT